MTYTFQAEAVRPGDARFQAEVTSAAEPKPITQQQSTAVRAAAN